ncbi:MAG: UbiA family prenyltransferase [Candidatus Diapherotrites archaeon]|nr:UbiA family prenyltransferase [Candidatus Diapherotrites archaeon]
MPGAHLTKIISCLDENQKGLLKESPHSVIVADMEGHVVACNAGAGDLFGYTKTEMIGTHVKVFHPPQNYARILPELFRTALQKGIYDQIITLQKKDHQPFLARIIVTRILGTDGKPIALMGVTSPAQKAPSIGFIATWIRALRAPFFTATLIPIFLGTAIAFSATGTFSFWPFFWTVWGMLFIHAGVNLANDYFDHQTGNDELNPHPTPFSGGSRVIQEGLVAPNTIRNVALLCLAVGSLIGLYLNSLVPGNLILVLGVLGVGIGFFYSSPPLAASYKRLGELCVALGFGPLIVLGSYVVQTQSFSIIPLVASIPIALLIVGVLFLNQFPDFEADVKSQKRNLLNTWGKPTGVKLLTYGVAAVFIFTGAGVISGLFPPLAGLTLLALPFAYAMLTTLRTHYDQVLELLPANANMIKLHFTYGLLFTIAFLVG